jgi:hypothetical protein
MLFEALIEYMIRDLLWRTKMIEIETFKPEPRSGISRRISFTGGFETQALRRCSGMASYDYLSDGCDAEHQLSGGDLRGCEINGSIPVIGELSAAPDGT